METKQLISAGNEAKLDTKSGTSQTGYTKEFKDQLVEIYNSGIYESAAECARNYKVPERLLYQWLSASKKQAKPGELSFELAKLKKGFCRKVKIFLSISVGSVRILPE